MTVRLGRQKSHKCEEGGALTPSKDQSRGKYFALDFKFMLGQGKTLLYGWVTKIQ